MFVRKLLSISCLFVIWLILRNYVFIDAVTSTVTEHPEWSDVRHHSDELMKSATRVARDSLIEVLEEDSRHDPGDASQASGNPRVESGQVLTE